MPTPYDTAVGIVAVNSPAFVQTALALLQQGRVIVTLRSAEDTTRIRIGKVGEVVAPEPGHGWFSPHQSTDHMAHADRVAQVMFTSGTEGEPKGVVLTQRGLADVVSRLNRVMQVDSTIREYVGVPVYHSFGFGRCRAVAAVGGQVFLPEHGFNPTEIAALLRADQINAISAVPSLWRILLAADAIAPELARRVRWIEIGSQHMSGAEKTQLRALFCNAIIVQHYGLTEASRSTFLAIHSATPDQLESVGCATGDVEIRITDGGRIAIRGPHVTPSLLIADVAHNPVDPDGWYETSDLGELRAGFLYYRGRADDVINCGGLKLSPEVLEAHVRQQLCIAGGFALCRTADALRGDGILVAASTELTVSDTQLLEATLLAAQESKVHARGAIQVWRVPALPRTASGKVKRRALSERFAAQQTLVPALPAAHSGDAQDTDKPLRAAFAKFVSAREVVGTDSFVSLGGDSLAFIQASVELERALGYLPQGWERLTLDELERLPVRGGGSSTLDASVWLRACAILAIAADHSGMLGTYLIPGGAFLLLVLSGHSFARFQLQRAVLEQRPWAVLSGLPKLLLPVLLLLGLQQLRHHALSLSQLLLVSNFVSTQEGGYWFIEVWTQIYVALFAALTLPSLTKALRARPVAGAAVALGIGVALRLLVPLAWNTEYLWHRVPHMCFWLFTLGWVSAVIRPQQRWALTLFTLVAGPVLGIGLGPQLWITAGALALTWLPALRMPASLAGAVSWVSAASLYIYIMEYYCYTVAARLAPFAAGLVGWLLVIMVGGGLRMAADAGWRKLAAARFRRQGLPRTAAPVVPGRP